MGQLQWIRNLRANFHSEREVETDIILAIASHLGYGPKRRAIGYSIPGTRLQADVVLFTGEQHVAGAALVVFEAKKPDNPQDPLPQAKRYAELLGAPVYATCNGECLAVYSTADHRLQFEASTLDVLEERWHGLEAVLHRSILMVRHPSRQLPQDMDVQASAHERTYRRRVQERFGQVQALKQHEGIDLRRVYVPTHVARVARRPVLRGDGEESRIPVRIEMPPGSQPQRADLAIREHPHLVVIGDLGTGKTTMLRHLALELAAGNIPSLDAIIPVYIPLNELFKERRQHDSVTIEEYFFEYFRRDAERMGIPRGDVWLRWWLERGSVILLWDGLDEVTGFATSEGGVPQAAEEATALIRSLAEQYRETRMVLTGRRGAWQHRVGNLPPDFVVVEALSFRPEDIETFVRAWFRQQPEKADMLLGALETKPQIKQLASNPLMITFMAIRYEEYGEWPAHDRYYLFSDTVHMLLRDWDQDPSRRVDRRPILKRALLRQLLGELALSLHTAGDRFMTKRQLERMVVGYLADVPHLEPEQMDDIIEHDLETKYGLIRPFFAGEYGFLHHSLQEFFAAEAIDLGHWDEWWPTGLLISHVGEPWWDEVFIHLAGGRHAETVIRALVDGEDDLFHTRLLLAGRCLAGVSARVNRAVQDRVVEGLFSLLGTMAGSRSAAILADIGTTAIADRLVNVARSGADVAVTMQALEALRRLRHPEAGTVALNHFEKGHVLHDAIVDLSSSADSTEVDRLAALARRLTPLGTVPLVILSKTTSPRALPALTRLMASPGESAAIRFAAALALVDTVPEAVPVLKRLWGDPEVQTLGWPSIPPGLAIELVTSTGLQQISIANLNHITVACRQNGFRVTDRRLQGLVAGARVLLGGRDTRRQVAAARLLAALGDETVRTVARRWLTQRRRADHAFALMAEFWPADLLQCTVPTAVVRNFVANHHPRLTELARRAAPVLGNWWQRGLVQNDPAAHFALLTALVEAGVTEAVPEFCAQLSRPERPTWRATPESVATLVALPGGRQLLLDALTRPDTWSEGEMTAILVALPASDRELLLAGLPLCISLIRKKGERWDLMDTLQHMARELDLIIWQDASAEIRYRPRKQVGM